VESQGSRGGKRLESRSIKRVGRSGFQEWKQMMLMTDSTASQRPSFANQVDAAIEKSSARSLPTVSADTPEDDESWLEVSPDELDGMLQRASGKPAQNADAKSEGKKVELGEEHGKALGDLAKKVEAFVGGQGDLEGARFAEYVS
jgi:hypothetical protein